jgi:hypothetical protein
MIARELKVLYYANPLYDPRAPLISIFSARRGTNHSLYIHVVNSDSVRARVEPGHAKPSGL